MAGYVRARGKRRDGTTKWQARYWDPKDPSRRVEKTFAKQREAERWLTTQGAAVLDGTHVNPRRSERPFPIAAEAWRETWADLEPKTKGGYEAILTRWLIGERDPLHLGRPCRFRNVKVGAVTPEMVQRFVNELASARQPNTVRRIYSVLRGVLKVAVERRYLAVNPCDAVKLPGKGANRNGARPTRMLFLNPPEVRTLAAAMPRPSDRLAVYIAAYCGLRAGELWALRRSDVDLLHGTLSVERALKEINTSADTDKGLLLGPTKTHASGAVR
jgi:integrase